ncbi:ribulokinase [Streptomyces sp. RKAG293]|uniref:ribulokinase n=1 Tax=Streptomyces sp. RKAG293 TaxID=2893403 RepID=UPI0035A97D3A
MIVNANNSAGTLPATAGAAAGASRTTPTDYVLGIDFGTLSGRAVVVRVSDGAEIGSAVHEYSHAVIDDRLPGSNVPLPPDWALQHPEDWLDVIRRAVPEAIAAAGIDPAAVIGIGTDFTASTCLPTSADGTPLCLRPELGSRPHAWPKLWKHHAAQPQADRITALAHERGEDWIARYGGLISSEWQYAKALQVLEEDPDTYRRTDRWIEAADWIVWQLTGVETRNTCTAGYKGIHQNGGYPSTGYLAALNPAFADFARTRLEHPLSPLGDRAGGLTARAAVWTGLPEGIAVAVGNVDAHVTAPAARSAGAGELLAVMGTSTCHILNGEQVAEVPGMCGVVDGGVVDGLWGFEAGQSGVGDIFGWFVEHGIPPTYHEQAAAEGISLHEHLTRLAAGQPVGGHGLVALDWWNGNRSVLVDHRLSGVLVGATLATRPPEIYRALLESTAFGTRVIVEVFEKSGVPVTRFTVAGGLTRNALLMQIYADVLRRPLSVAASEQAPALGSAIHAAVAAGAYENVPAAAERMGRVHRDRYLPDAARADAYDRLFAEYRALHDLLGGEHRGVLHRLRELRNATGTSAAN